MILPHMNFSMDELILVNNSCNTDKLGLALQEIETKIGDDLFRNILSSNDFISFDKLIPLKEAKAKGVYFTPMNLASKMAIDLNKIEAINKDSVIIDPTCGCGALLLAVTEYLPVGKNLIETLSMWGEMIYGVDLNESFIYITKIFLINEARKKTMDLKYYDLSFLKSLLPNIIQADFFDRFDMVKKATHIISNPPYHKIKIDYDHYKLYGGSVNVAAIITHKLIVDSDNVSFNILLPEVLRVGARYEKWRKVISSSCYADITVHGVFGPSADVDVFSLQGKTNAGQNKIAWKRDSKITRTLKDDFYVHVGNFVPHRDVQEGEYASYIHAKNITDFSTINQISEEVKTKKRLVKPPFVVIKRTSSPSDKKRARAAIINTPFPVLVENHLITLSPISGGLTECERVLEILSSKKTDDFLNENIRCRHLTVGIIKDIPYPNKEN